MDKRKNNGGSRKGSGRKKGTGVSCKIKKYVEEMMFTMLEDESIKNQIMSELKQLSLSSGWIYVIKDLDNNEIKIGVTQKESPRNRLSQYTSHKMNIELLFIDNIEDCFELENEIHILFENRRVKGDWFDLTKVDVLKIIYIINQHKYKKLYNGRQK
tara:strand:- start:73 stop:543 length:471 start_codon:yes stop_codon:yes gene_type:complete